MADRTLTTNTQTNGAGVINHAVGRAISDAGATGVAMTITCGFIPRVIRWINLTDRISSEWFEGMADDSGLETAAAGTRTLETSGGITNNDDGTFTVHADLVPASKTFAWEALG